MNKIISCLKHCRTTKTESLSGTISDDFLTEKKSGKKSEIGPTGRDHSQREKLLAKL